MLLLLETAREEGGRDGNNEKSSRFIYNRVARSTEQRELKLREQLVI